MHTRTLPSASCGLCGYARVDVGTSGLRAPGQEGRGVTDGDISENLGCDINSGLLVTSLGQRCEAHPHWPEYASVMSL